MTTTLEELRCRAQSCTACALSETRTKVVFGAGNPAAKVMLIGEAPGANEDLRGEPFVGRAGVLLDKMLLAAGFSRSENIYIANMIKCRPPENRDPTPDETAACGSFLRGQIAAVAPKIIVCLGRIAAQAMISPDFRVTKEHGVFREKGGILYMGTFHPALLLRSPSYKPDAFADLLAVRQRVASQD
ncbi:MAG: uracil-DNA glycosylase [Oscillospiraceae bacterium]|nr:uracil-DNA glycosylase [Oscillospiraceae bacterium]